MNDSQQQAVPAFFSLMRAYIDDQHCKNFENTNQGKLTKESSTNSQHSTHIEYDLSLDSMMRCLDILVDDSKELENTTDIKNTIKRLLQESSWTPLTIESWVNVCNRFNGWALKKKGKEWSALKWSLCDGCFMLGNLVAEENDVRSETINKPWAHVVYISISGIKNYLKNYQTAYEIVSKKITKREISSLGRDKAIQEQLNILNKGSKNERILFSPVLIQYNGSKNGSQEWLLIDKDQQKMTVDLSQIPERYLKCDVPACITFVEGKKEYAKTSPYIVKGKTFTGGPQRPRIQKSSTISNESSVNLPSIKRYLPSKEDCEQAPDKFRSINLDITKEKQTTSGDCLVKATELINNYCSNMDVNKTSLPEKGNPGDAHVMIKEWGHEISCQHQYTYAPVDKDAAEGALFYINNCLKKGFPVLVGLNYRSAENKNYINNDGVTDHFSIIKGLDKDDENYIYLILQDVASENKEYQLYVRKSDYAIVALTAPYYQVTQVRIYPDDLDNFYRLANKRPRRVANRNLKCIEEVPERSSIAAVKSES